jgi:hypothetical protein
MARHRRRRVLAPALDGGWWALGLADPSHAPCCGRADVQVDTRTLTAAALRGLGLTVLGGPVLRDVDLADDALAVAAQCPAGRFAAAVHACLHPQPPVACLSDLPTSGAAVPGACSVPGSAAGVGP